MSHAVCGPLHPTPSPRRDRSCWSGSRPSRLLTAWYGRSPAGTRRRPVSDTVRAVSPAEIGAEETPSLDARLATIRALPGYGQDLTPLRTYTLRQASIDEIPHFMELTTLYIGAIVPALAAVFFVLLKEYARRAMGLSDREVILRTRSEDPLVPDLPRLSSGERSRP